MPKNKIDWKHRCGETEMILKASDLAFRIKDKDLENVKTKLMAAEKCAKLLQIEADEVGKTAHTYMKENLELRNELDDRPTIEKIVEKEVLPWWLLPLLIVMMGLGALWIKPILKDFKKLQTPIEKPHEIAEKWDMTAINNVVADLKYCVAHDKAATDSWREDEAKIKRLRMECR